MTFADVEPGGHKRPAGTRRTQHSYGSLGASGAALLLMLTTIGACGSAEGDDELQPRRPRATFGLESLTPKQTKFTVSTVHINAPGQEVEILGLRPVMTPNLTYLGAVTVWPRARDSYSDGGPGFPSSAIKDFHPAIGTVIPASETAFKGPDEETPNPVYVNAGFSLASGTVGAVNDVEVTYRVGKEVKRERSGVAVVACMRPCEEREQYEDVRAWQIAVLEQFGMKQTED